MTSAQLVLIRLLAWESIAPRGTRKISWLVYLDHRWQSAKDYPGAVFERLDAAPGTVWQTAAELRVAPGTWLQRVESSPMPREHSDPMSYLRREVRGTRRTVSRTFYRVTRTGELRRPPKETTPPEDSTET